MTDINVNFDPAAFLARITKVQSNIPQALKAAGVAVLTQAQKAITSGGDGWAERKRLPKRPHQILWDTGTLLRSLTVGGAGNVFEQEDSQVTVGSNVAYAAAQQFGYSPHALPARPYFVFSDSYNDQVARVFLKYLMAGVTNDDIT